MNPAELFRNDSDMLTLAPGEKLFSAGDAGAEMFVLIEGEADIIVGDTVVERSKSGALVGEMALIEDSPRAATVVAATECKFARISHRRFLFLVQQTPFFALHVMKILADRLRHMNERVMTHA